MKYLDLVALHEVDQALSFDTDSVAVIGGVEAYTIKAAGADKKLYKFIEEKLENQHKEAIKQYEELPDEKKAEFAADFNLKRNSPFGSFQSRANRKKFAYLIGTLNATHVDYEFSNAAKPDDFRRDTMDNVIQTVDLTMYNLRPYCYSGGLAAGALTPLGSPIWNPKMWSLIDEEMGLRECEFYVWEPDSDPFQGEDGSLWSFHFFLYNKSMKRVCYLYLRGVSSLSNSPEPPTSLVSKYKHEQWSRPRHTYDHTGACKDCLDNLVIDHPGEEVVDAEEYPSVREREMSQDYYYSTEDDSDIEYLRQRKKGRVRALSENIMEKMDV
jgi:hypothetical protein